MPLQARAGTAFRWRPNHLLANASDVVRVREDSGVHLALLANGYECGFSTCWPPASRLMLDLFVEAWLATNGPPRERLLTAFDGSRRRFTERAPGLTTPDADFPGDTPDAVLLAAAFDGSAFHIAWIGTDVAVVARNGRVLLETSPHTLVEQLAREHPGALDPAAVPNVTLRTVTQPSDALPDAVVADAAPGDTLLLVSHVPFGGPIVSPADLALATAKHSSADALAEHVAGIGFANDSTAYAAAAVLRVDGG